MLIKDSGRRTRGTDTSCDFKSNGVYDQQKQLRFQWALMRRRRVRAEQSRLEEPKQNVVGSESAVFRNMEQAFYVRNPYPVPDVSREGAWIRRGPVLGDKVSPSDRDWNAKLSAHERLFAHHTLNSIRRDHRLVRPKVPDDALDFALDAVYVHSRDSLVSKKYVPMQAETLGKETWRVLRNEIKISPEPPKSDRPMHVSGYQDLEPLEPFSPDKTRLYCGPALPRRIHPSSVKLNIEGPHMNQSNPGYSRKIDGTFYSI